MSRVLVCFLALLLAGNAWADDAAFKPRTRVSIDGTHWRINGKLTCPGTKAGGLLLNVRMVNAVFEDRKRPKLGPEANTTRFLKSLPDYTAHGVRAFTLCLQGGMPGYEGAVNSAFNADGGLRPAYLKRVERVIRACDERNAVVILGCFYQRQDQALKDEKAVRAGAVAVARWCKERGFTNVVLEVANEFDHPGFDHAVLKSARGQAELVLLAKRTAPGLLVATSGLGHGKLPDDVARASDFLLVHLNSVKADDIPARLKALQKYKKPIVVNEDDKVGEEGARAARSCVANGASWGLMAMKVNQYSPFRFQGAKDDPVVYRALKELSSPAPVYPGKTWGRKAPEEAGLDKARLEAFRKYVGGRACVARDGYLVYSFGDIGKRADVASACKPWFTHFLLVAVEEKAIKGLDDLVVAFEPRLKGKDRLITWRHLANQVSCYGVEEKPGTAYDYSDYNMALFFDALFLGAYKTTWAKVDADVLRPKLAGPLGCEDDPTFMAFGTGNRPGRLAASVRDMARFGLLYLRKGKWRDRQLISEEHVALAVGSPLPARLPRTTGKPAEMVPKQRSIGGGNNQTDHMGSYSFAWWTNGLGRDGRRHWPGVPVDAYGAFGHGGKRAVVVIPSLGLVVSWNDARVDGRKMQVEALKLLVGAVKK